MNLKNPVVAMIAVSLIGALAIIIASNLLAGQESAQTATYVIIAIWWVPFSILAARAANRDSK